jgi:D-inositol-3-phosphate glycosyltransferase
VTAQLPPSASLSVALLTGGDDRSYALGLTGALATHGIAVDFIGSDALDAPELHQSPLIRFLNLRRDQRRDASVIRKVIRILAYYLRLIRYAASAKPRVFHILWNNKFEFVDRVLLMLYYRALGKRVVLTAHNVNAGKRDGTDSWLNRWTLTIQYRLCCHVFVHTPRMKTELETDFRLSPVKVSVIPFGINNTTPRTGVTRQAARARFGLAESDRTLLFFGQIAPYKGLEYLVEAMKLLVSRQVAVRVIIAGKVKPGCEDYWSRIRTSLEEETMRAITICHVRFIPDAEVEWFMQAADAVALPYVSIFQSGVPFLAYSFGLPVLATDVGSLREDVLEDRTGYIATPCDPAAFAAAISRYFASDMYRQSDVTRSFIQTHANERHSWETVGKITHDVYRKLADGGEGMSTNKDRRSLTAGHQTGTLRSD